MSYGYDPNTGHTELYNSSGRSQSGHYRQDFDEHWSGTAQKASENHARRCADADEALRCLVPGIIVLGIVIGFPGILIGLGYVGAVQLKGDGLASLWSLSSIVSTLPILLVVWGTNISLQTSECKTTSEYLDQALEICLMIVCALAGVGPSKAALAGLLFFLPLATNHDREGRDYYLRFFFILIAGGWFLGLYLDYNVRPWIAQSFNVFGMTSQGGPGALKVLVLGLMAIVVGLFLDKIGVVLCIFAVLGAMLFGMSFIQNAGNMLHLRHFVLGGAQLLLIFIGVICLLPLQETAELKILREARLKDESWGLFLKYSSLRVSSVLFQHKLVALGLILLVCREVADGFGLLRLL